MWSVQVRSFVVFACPVLEICFECINVWFVFYVGWDFIPSSYSLVHGQVDILYCSVLWRGGFIFPCASSRFEVGLWQLKVSHCVFDALPFANLCPYVP